MKISLSLLFVTVLFSASLVYATSFATLHLDDMGSTIRDNTIITFSGQLTTFDGTPIPHRTIFIQDDTSYLRPEVILSVTVTDDNGKFSTSWKVVPKNNGNPYHFYALFIGGKTYGFSRSETYETVITHKNSTINQKQPQIPNWLKDSSKLWHDGQIRDLDFAYGIENLMEQGIMEKPNQTSSDIVIPAWVKNNANWYAQGQISDQDFVGSIQYLINARILSA